MKQVEMKGLRWPGFANSSSLSRRWRAASWWRPANWWRPAAVVLAFALVLVAAPSAAQAENLIKQPGAHNRYKWELEPRLGLYYGGWGWRGRDRFNRRWGWGGAFGPGVHASIPFMHNGPIDTINNNIGIHFGVDTYFPPNTAILSFPVAFQWNFYFTDIISVVGEVGLVSNVWTGYGGWFEIDPLFQGGGRFQFGKVGVIVRVGWPSISVGANIQF